MARLVASVEQGDLRLAAKVRVIYGDTDRMGIVYHGTYLRYLEHARVEHMRAMGVIYARLERSGYGLPVTDLAATYLASARYDDLVSIWVRVAKVGAARLWFEYEVSVEAGDREELEERILLIRAQTRHACVTLEDGRPTRFPDPIYATLTGAESD